MFSPSPASGKLRVKLKHKVKVKIAKVCWRFYHNLEVESESGKLECESSNDANGMNVGNSETNKSEIGLV